MSWKEVWWGVSAALLLVAAGLSYVLSNAQQFELSGVPLAVVGLVNFLVATAIKLVPGGLAPPSDE